MYVSGGIQQADTSIVIPMYWYICIVVSSDFVFSHSIPDG